MVRDNHPAGFFAYFFSFDRFVKGEVERKSALSSLQSAKESILAKEQKISQLEADLKIEREWRQRLQTASVVDKEALAKGKVELTHLQPIAKVNNWSFSSKNRNQKATPDSHSLGTTYLHHNDFYLDGAID